MPSRVHICGPIASTARSKTFSSFRTRWRRASPASSSQLCNPPKPRAQWPAQRSISPHTTSTCVPMLWFFTAAQQIPEALRLLEKASERDPSHGPTLALAAVCHARLVIDGRSEDPEADTRKGTDFARRALKVAGDDPVVLANTA